MVIKCVFGAALFFLPFDAPLIPILALRSVHVSFNYQASTGFINAKGCYQIRCKGRNIWDDLNSVHK